jgi:hypothetical protein
MKTLGDEADQANRLAEAERESMIARAARAAASAPSFGSTGECHSCFEPIPHPKRFCGPSCEREWARRIRRR